ncbi:MAG: hypothetical protein NTV24_04700 [Candidatus Woesebacteria bacterium]|nr:hypothetical protein [Candidatus Woesebacteria bacterium]
MGRKEIFIGLFVILVIIGIVFGIKKAEWVLQQENLQAGFFPR